MAKIPLELAAAIVAISRSGMGIPSLFSGAESCDIAAQAASNLVLWLQQNPSIPQSDQMKLLSIQLHQPKPNFIQAAAMAFEQVSDAARCILRPLLLLLQQYVLRQVDYDKQLKQLAYVFAPLLLPTVCALGAVYLQRARDVMAATVSEALHIFNAASQQQQQQQQQQSQNLGEMFTTGDSQEEEEEEEEEEEDEELEQEGWLTDQDFVPVFGRLLASTVECTLFSADDEDAASIVGTLGSESSDSASEEGWQLRWGEIDEDNRMAADSDEEVVAADSDEEVVAVCMVRTVSASPAKRCCTEDALKKLHGSCCNNAAAQAVGTPPRRSVHLDSSQAWQQPGVLESACSCPAALGVFSFVESDIGGEELEVMQRLRQVVSVAYDQQQQQSLQLLHVSSCSAELQYMPLSSALPGMGF